MPNFDIVVRGSIFDKTINLRRVLGKRLISKNGKVVGKISELRMTGNGLTVSGIVISRGFLAKKVFFGKEYIDRLTEDSVILNVDPYFLLKRLRVVSSEGEVIGKVIDFVRINESNEISYLVVRGFMRGVFNVPFSYIKSVGYSIILKPIYEPPKKHFWKRT